MYKDVHLFVSTCESYQMHSRIRHRDGRFSDNGSGSRANAVHGACTRGPNEPGGRPSVDKQDDHSHMPILIEDFCRYGCVGKIVADRGELTVQEAEELFDRLGVEGKRTSSN